PLAVESAGSGKETHPVPLVPGNPTAGQGIFPLEHLARLLVRETMTIGLRARTTSDDTMSHARPAFALLVVLLASGFASAQVKEPPRPETLDIQIRYRIRADRDERVRQFRALEKHLASLGFDDARKNDPDR